MYQGLQKIVGRADTLNMYNQYTGDPGYLPKDIARYAAVTPATVQRAVRAHLRKDARVVVFAVRGAKKLDPEPAVGSADPHARDRVDQRRRDMAPQAAAGRSGAGADACPRRSRSSSPTG